MATLEQRLVAVTQAFGADIKAARLARGDLTQLTTTNKTNLVAAINEVFAAIGAAGAAINDTSGDGETTFTWSANKIFDEIAAARLSLKNELTSGAAAALDTFAELAAAMGNDPNFATTIATGLGLRVRVDASQTFTAPQRNQARNNIGAGSAVDVTQALAETAALASSVTGLETFETNVGNTDVDLVATYVTAKT
jgi:hypothetical protein